MTTCGVLYLFFSFVVVEADSLLKREAETLAEALETANNAVFLALSTISIMISVGLLPCDPHLNSGIFFCYFYHVWFSGESSEVAEFTKWTEERSQTNGSGKSRGTLYLLYSFLVHFLGR